MPKKLINTSLSLNELKTVSSALGWCVYVGPKYRKLLNKIDRVIDDTKKGIKNPDKPFVNEPKFTNMCQAARDGECNTPLCPQIRDGEPEKTGRHCPIDNRKDESV